MSITYYLLANNHDKCLDRKTKFEVLFLRAIYHNNIQTSNTAYLFN